MHLDQVAESEIAKTTKVIKVANTWADHFQVLPNQRAEFIDHYVSRNTEHRFWCVTYSTHTLCRLGTVVLYFDGRRVSAHPVAYTIKYSDRKKLTHRAGIKVPNRTPSQAEFNNIKRAIKRRGDSKIEHLGLLSTFSKEFRKIATTEILMDVRKLYISLEKNRDCRYVNPRTNWYMSLGAFTLKQFSAQLPAEPLKAIRSIHCPSIQLFNWIMAGNIAHRIQAVKAYPLLLPCIFLARLPDDEYDTKEFVAYFDRISQVRADLGNLVDGGQSIRSYLANFYECSEKTIRTIGKYKTHHTGSILTRINHNGRSGLCHYILHDVITAASLGNKQPQCKTGWSNWFSFFGRHEDFYNRCGRDIGWPSFLASMPEWSSDLWPGLLKNLHDLRDLTINDYGDHYWDEAIQDYRYNIRWPALNLKTMLSISQKWHDHRAEKLKELIDQAEHKKKTNQVWTWQTMLTELVIHEGTQVSIVELDCPEQLVEEAIELEHCVDGYSSYCFDGYSRIVSFRQGGKRLATAEFRLTESKGKPTPNNLYCAQLRGFDNDDIPTDSPAGQAFAWLCKQITSRTIQVNLNWPCVPANHRPGAGSGIDHELQAYMKQWLRNELGV